MKRSKNYRRSKIKLSRNTVIILLTVLVLMLVSFLTLAKKGVSDNIPTNGEAGEISSDVSVDNSSKDSSFLTLSSAKSATYGPYEVVRVVDGDTYKINIDGTEQTVRLIGVDTPESVSSDESKNCVEGKDASVYVKNLITGKMVYLEYDAGQTDKYGRVLAYVYYEGVQLEKILLEMGYARTMTIAPNVNYADEYAKIQTNARESNTGFWETNPWGD